MFSGIGAQGVVFALGWGDGLGGSKPAPCRNGVAKGRKEKKRGKKQEQNKKEKRSPRKKKRRKTKNRKRVATTKY